MKKFIQFTLMCLLSAVAMQVQAQDIDTSKTYMVIKNDGTEYVGKILSKDGREVLMKTAAVGEIYIPMHEIKEIRVIDEKDITKSGVVLKDDPFASRYFLTTSAFPVDKGGHYIQWNYWGPDFQFGVSDNFGVGIMTSWIAIPIIANAKYTFPVSENGKTNIAVGALIGTLSYALPDYYGALPYLGVTVGDKQANLTMLAGSLILGGEGESYTNPLLGINGMSKIGEKVSFVFESIVVLPTQGTEATSVLLLPGLRFHTKPGRAFQFGFTGIAIEGDFSPIPIPMLQFYQSL